MKNSGLLLLIVLFMVGCGPRLSPEELEAKWRAPIGISALNVGICEGAMETARKVAAGESEGFAAFGEVLGVGVMIQAVDEALAEAQPVADQSDLVTQMRDDVEALKGVLGPWINGDSTAADVLDEIDGVCQGVNDSFELVVERAADDGLSEEAARAVLEEMSEAMEVPLEGGE